MAITRTPQSRFSRIDSEQRHDASPSRTSGEVEKDEQREHLRFDKAFPVRLESLLFGEFQCIARNVSAGGIFVEISEPLPLGSHIRVCFLTPDETGEVVALGTVKNHYFINVGVGDSCEPHSVCGMALRFSGFEQESERHLRACLNRFRVLH